MLYVSSLPFGYFTLVLFDTPCSSLFSFFVLALLGTQLFLFLPRSSSSCYSSLLFDCVICGHGLFMGTSVGYALQRPASVV